MKTRLVVLASILIVAVACGQTAAAAAAAAGKTYYVSTSGDDSADGLAEKTAWRTIAHAAKVAKAGDTVKIKAGKYDGEHVVIDNSGTKDRPIVFEGYDGTPLLDGKDRTGKGILIGSTKGSKEYIILRNLKLTRYRWGVLLYAKYATLDNITVTNLGGRGYDGWGIYLQSSHHCILRNCSVTDARAVNFQIWHSNHNLIENCTSYGIETDNAVDYYIAVGHSHDNVIRNCLTQNKHPLVKVHAGHGIILKYKNYNNKVINCVARGHGEAIGAALFSHDNEFRDCTVYDDGQHKVPGWGGGLFARNGSYRNKFINCRTIGVKTGILLQDNTEELYKEKNPIPIQRDNVFENCIIDARDIGIFIRNTQHKGSQSINNRIRNCIITGPKILIYVAGAESGNTITNSIITGIPGKGSSSKFSFSYCNFWDNGFKTPPGAGNMSKNPLFVNAGKGDFRLKPDSLCRGAGEHGIDMGVLEPWSRPIWVVHAGGDWDGPENTVAALKKSVALGARYAEIDLRITKDGQVVVIHDETLDRTTNGKGRVKELAYAQIKRYDAGSRFRPEFKGERVPLLSEVLDFARIHDMRLLLDVKEPEVCPLLFGLLKKHGMVDNARVYMIATDAAVRKALDPRIKQYSGSLVQPWGYRKGPKIVLDALKNRKKGGALMRSYTCVLEAQKMETDSEITE